MITSHSALFGESHRKKSIIVDGMCVIDYLEFIIPLFARALKSSSSFRNWYLRILTLRLYCSLVFGIWLDDSTDIN